MDFLFNQLAADFITFIKHYKLDRGIIRVLFKSTAILMISLER